MKIIGLGLAAFAFAGTAHGVETYELHPSIHQRVREFVPLEIRGETPVGSFLAQVGLRVSQQGELFQLSIKSVEEKAFDLLASSGVHVTQNFSMDSLSKGASMIEIRNLIYNGTKVPISGVLLSAKLEKFSAQSGGSLVLKFFKNMVSRSSETIELKLATRIVEVGGGESQSRFWYVSDSNGRPVSTLKVNLNEWDLPLVGKVPVGISDVEIHDTTQFEVQVEEHQKKELEFLNRETNLNWQREAENTIRYLKMTVQYFDTVLERLPKNSPSRADFLKSRGETLERLSALQEELKIARRT